MIEPTNHKKTKRRKGKELNLVGIVENKNLKILSISQRYTNHNLSFGIAFKHIYPIKLDKKKTKKNL